MKTLGIVVFAASCGLTYLGEYSHVKMNIIVRVGIIVVSRMLGILSIATIIT